jgi:phosphate transport system permease protein
MNSTTTAPAAQGSAANNGQGELHIRRSLTNRRSLFSFVMSILTVLATVIALVPLFSVVLMLLFRGGRNISLDLFTELPPVAGDTGGGIANALIGTLVMVTIAGAISIPFGVLAAIYLSEFGSHTKTADIVRFSAKVLTGLPSILAGVFSYTLVVVTTGERSAFAGGVALALLMLPIVILTAEEALKQVPQKMRDAAVGMGATHTQVVWHVVLPTALPTMLTGVMLAVARAAGETAPLLFTAMWSIDWPSGDLFDERTPSLAVLIYKFANVPYERQIELAWAASLVLVFIVLTLNIIGQRVAGKSEQ